MSEFAENNTVPNSPKGDQMMNKLPGSLNTSDQSSCSFEDTFRHFDISAIDYSDLSSCPAIPFFAGGERRAVLDEVAHLCQFSHNLVGVLGDAGVGKTAFAYQAAIELSEAADCCVLVSSLMNSTENMLLLLAQQLGIFIAEDASLDQIIATINQYQPSGIHQSVVIIVDEAHHLAETALSAFVQLLQIPSPNYFHVLLIGDSTLQIKLDRLDKESVLVYDIPLRAFNEGEIEHYVSFKLAQAGYHGAELFDANALEHLWRETKGFPQKINHIANKMLLAASDIDGDGQRLGLPVGYMAVVVVLLAALILAVFYIDDAPLPPAVPSGEVSMSGQAAASSDEQASTLAISSDLAVQDETVESELSEQKNLGNVVLSAAQTPSGLTEVGASVDSVEDTGSTDESNFSIVDDSSLPISVGSEVDRSGEDTSTQAVIEFVVTNDTLSDINASNGNAPNVTKEKVAEAPKLSASVTASTVAGGSKQLGKQLGATPSVKAPPALNITSGEVAVMSWPNNNYTLQVMAAGQLTSVNRFVNTQSNRDLLRVITLRRNGAPWYVVFTGVYETREEAISAISFLSPSQKNAQPWPRRISDIQQKISDFRRK